MKWTIAALVSVSLMGCLRGPFVCESDSDCFAGEACNAGACVVAVDWDATPEQDCTFCKPDPQPLQPAEGEVVVSDEEVIFDFDVELDETGPQIAWVGSKTRDVRITRWTGDTWRTEPLSIYPTPYQSIDLQVVDGRRGVAFTSIEGDAMWAEEGDDGAWDVQLAMKAPAPFGASNYKAFAFVAAALGSGGSTAYVCGIYDALFETEEHEEQAAEVWVATREEGEWTATLMESDVRGVTACSVVVDDVGAPHVVYSQTEAGVPYLQHATRPLGTFGPWERHFKKRRGTVLGRNAVVASEGSIHAFATYRSIEPAGEFELLVQQSFDGSDWQEREVRRVADPQRRSFVYSTDVIINSTGVDLFVVQGEGPGPRTSATILRSGDLADWTRSPFELEDVQSFVGVGDVVLHIVSHPLKTPGRLVYHRVEPMDR